MSERPILNVLERLSDLVLGPPKVAPAPPENPKKKIIPELGIAIEELEVAIEV